MLSASAGTLVLAVRTIAAFIQSRHVTLSLTGRNTGKSITVDFAADNVVDVMPVLVHAVTSADGVWMGPTLSAPPEISSRPVMGLNGPATPRRPNIESPDLHVAIYLEDGATHEDVEIAVGRALTAAGLTITERGNPIIGSWWRTFRAKARQTAASPAGREAAAVAVHAAEQRVVLDKDAEITAKLMQNLGPGSPRCNPSGTRSSDWARH